MTSVHAPSSFLNTGSAEGRTPARHSIEVARLTLFINGRAYKVHPLPADGVSTLKAFRLRKFDGTEYDIAQGGEGITCDCPDFTFHREGIDPAGCKHIKALVSCGLIDRDRRDTPTPVPVPAKSTRQEQESRRPSEPEKAGPNHDLTPALVPANGQPKTLVEIVEHEVLGYKAWGSAAGSFLADQLGRIAQLLRWTGAQNAQDYEDRMELYDRELRDRHYDQGYHDGFEAGHRQACPCGRKHD
jgi:hypothetical protein